MIDAQKKLQIGAYSTRTILFDPFTTYYEVVTPNAENNEEDLKKLGGNNLPVLNPELINLVQIKSSQELHITCLIKEHLLRR